MPGDNPTDVEETDSHKEEDEKSLVKEGSVEAQKKSSIKYASRKTAAQGLLDLALMLANASQLKSVVQEGPSHAHYHLLIVLITLSIGLQLTTAFVLLAIGRMESKYDDIDLRNEKIVKLNNASVALILLITVSNIFITSFGIHGDTSPRYNSVSSMTTNGT